jgi:signal transduction histidine kinase
MRDALCDLLSRMSRTEAAPGTFDHMQMGQNHMRMGQNMMTRDGHDTRVEAGLALNGGRLAGEREAVRGGIRGGGGAMSTRTNRGKSRDGRARHALSDRTREVVHDLRQPAVCISALVASARASVGPDDELSWQLDGIDQQVGVLLATVASLLDADVGGTLVAPLGAFAADVVTAARLSAPQVTVVATRGLASAPTVRGAPTDIRRALTNVVDNAVRAAGPGGRVEVAVERDGPDVQVVVQDDGPGFGRIPPQRMIGLRSAVRCLESAGGSLEVGDSRRLGGARVVLGLVAVDDVRLRRAAPGV